MIWQYIRWFFWIPNLPKWRKRRKSLWDEAIDIWPGQISIVTDKSSGVQYAILHLDDLEHVLSLSSIRLTNISNAENK